MLAGRVVRARFSGAMPAQRGDHVGAGAGPALAVPAAGRREHDDLHASRSTADRHGPCVRPDVYDIDLYNNDGTALNTAAVYAIHAVGVHAVCYVDAGTWENWRPDAGAVSRRGARREATAGRARQWVDIRRTDVLLPILDARVGEVRERRLRRGRVRQRRRLHEQAPGSRSPPPTSSRSTRASPSMAHDHGLSVGLKNDLDQLGALQNDVRLRDQRAVLPVQGVRRRTTAGRPPGKAVVEVEYTGNTKKYCADADRQRPRRDQEEPELEGQAVDALPLTPPANCR